MLVQHHGSGSVDVGRIVWTLLLPQPSSGYLVGRYLSSPLSDPLSWSLANMSYTAIHVTLESEGKSYEQVA